MKRFALFSLACLVVASPARAQDTARAPAAQQQRVLRNFPIDRIVAVVGSRPILWSEVLEVVQQRQAAGVPIPRDSAGQLEYARQLVSELVDEEVLVQQAEADTSIDVADADLTQTVEDQLRRLRQQVPSEQQFLSALRESGFGSLEEYRRWLTEQARRTELQRRFVQRAQAEGRMVPVAVTEKEVSEAFEKNKDRLPKRPPSVTFRQIVLATQASNAAKAAARAKAESLLVEVRGGANFEQVARRESMDPGSKDQGGDLGWNRRDQMVPEFDRVMFALPPGQVSNVVETQYGFHIIKVERARPSEVKARHILIRPQYDSADVARTRARADSVLRYWQSGALPFDSLVRRYHDRDEVENVLEPFPRDSLPASYRTAIEGKGQGEFVGPFEIADQSRGVPKYVVAQLTQVIEAGDYTVADLRERIRSQLAQERGYRRLVEQLRKKTYVVILPLEGRAEGNGR